jgi:SAM-dependent methyltransferase
MADRQAHLSLVNGDTFCLPYPDAAFDLVFSQGLLEHFADPVPPVREQIRVLRPGGYLCVDVPQTLSPVTLRKRWHVWRGTWFAGWETSFTLGQLERLLREQGLGVVTSYGHIYPELGNALRNLHTLDERRALPVWFGPAAKRRVEGLWRWLESRRWYYRFMACIGVVARKGDAQLAAIGPLPQESL